MKVEEYISAFNTATIKTTTAELVNYGARKPLEQEGSVFDGYISGITL